MTEQAQVRYSKDYKQPAFCMIEHVIFDDEEIFETIYDKHIYLELRRFANYNTGKAFPALETIAKRSRCSINKARDAIKVLEKLELIRVERSINRVNVYEILPIPEVFYPPQDGGQDEDIYPPQDGVQNVYPPQDGGQTPQHGVYPPQGGVYPPQDDNEINKYKEKQLNKKSEKEKQQEETAAAAAPIDPFFDALQKLGNGRANFALQYEMISSWQEEGFEDASISLALEKAMSAAKDFAYAQGIIKQWRKKKLFTYEQTSQEGKRQAKQAAAGESQPLKNFEDLSPTDKKIVENLRQHGDLISLPTSKQFLKAYV